MKELINELERNFHLFSKDLKEQLKNTNNELSTYIDPFQTNYNRLNSLEAWKSIFEIVYDENKLFFFTEAQNDALVSHLLCTIGAWRASLQCLRACLENILYFIYYKDHPIELSLWDIGKNKLPISDYLNYFYNHPYLIGLPEKLDPKILLKNEYSTLSKAVHGSTVNFQMTKNNVFPAVMICDKIRLNMTMEREKSVFLIINLMLITLHSVYLQGAKYRNQRKIISLSIPHEFHKEIQTHLRIKLFV